MGSIRVDVIEGNERTKAEYFDGLDAFRRGLDEVLRPFIVSDSRRTGWYMGYLDAQTNAKFGPIFKQWGVAFP